MVKINLMPPAERVERKFAIKLPPISLYEILGVLIVGGTFLWILVSCGAIKGKISSIEHQISQAQKELKSLRDVKQRVDLLRKRSAELNNKVQGIKKIVPYTTQEVVILDEISRLLPQYMWLEELNHNTQGRTVSLKGYAFSSLSIADFITNLQKSKVFSDVTFKLSSKQEKEKVEVISFSLDLQVIPTQEIMPTGNGGEEQ